MDAKVNHDGYTENTAPEVRINSIDYDPWAHWSNGPMLRKSSYTARQLFYLTPEAIHLENRKVFIGEFPDGWVEANVERYFHAIWKGLDRMSAIWAEPAQKPDSHRFADNELRRMAELKVATNIADETGTKIRNESTKRRRLMKAMQKRRNRFRAHHLSVVQLESEISALRHLEHRHNLLDEGSNGPSKDSKFAELLKKKKKGSIDEQENVPAQLDEKSKETPKETYVSPVHKYPEHEEENSKEPDSSQKTRNSPESDCPKTDNPVSSGAQDCPPKGVDRDGDQDDCSEGAKLNGNASVDSKSDQRTLTDSTDESVFYDCGESLSGGPVAAGSTLEHTKSTTPDSKTLEAKVLQTPDTQKHDAKDSIELTNNSSQSKHEGTGILDKDHGTSHLKPHTRRKKRAQKIYHGRFLIQERKSRSARPVVSEVDAPLATQLVTRWKECAILVKQTNNPQKPLVLYFYDTVNKDKLMRRSQRRWTRSLAFKVALDPHFEVTMFSPLDLTLALWRPQIEMKEARRGRSHLHSHYVSDRLGIAGEEDLEGKSETQVLLIHSQSISEIMDLAYLLTSATRGAPWLHGTVMTKISVPCVGADVQVRSHRSVKGALEEIRQAELNQHALLSYYELLGPVVSGSMILRTFMKSVWGVIEKLPRRLHVSPELTCNKHTLAWMSPGLEYRPLWLSSAAPSFFPISWLNWLMDANSKLALVQPSPRCWEVSDMEEPEAVEGYGNCVNLSFHASLQNAGPQSFVETFSSKHDASLYIFTADHYLMYTYSQDALPPMLASNQNIAEKVVDPYPLSEDKKDITWIRDSTCLQEIDYRDMIATLEHERRTDLIARSQCLVNLLHYNSFDANDKGQVKLTSAGNLVCVLSFGSNELSAIWATRLERIAEYWKQAHKAYNIRRLAGSLTDFGITPYLQNRSIVYSGALFMKQHRFATFKAFQVILTTKALIIFRIDQTRRPPAQPSENVPSNSFLHRHYMTIDLQSSYVYTGQSTSHVLLEDDVNMDPSNPGNRALPRAYEDGWISRDTELDRCFVLWQRRKEKFRVFASAGDGHHVAFLAQEKSERDKWSSAIRHVQTSLAAKLAIDEDLQRNGEADAENDSESDDATS